MSLHLYSNVHLLEVGDALTDFEDGYTLYDARYVRKAGDTMTGALLVDGSSNTTQLRVQGHSTQTSKLQTWENSAGDVVADMDAAGTFRSGTIYSDQTIKLGLNAPSPFYLEHSALPTLEMFHVNGTLYKNASNSDDNYAANFTYAVNTQGYGTNSVGGFNSRTDVGGGGTVPGIYGVRYLVRVSVTSYDVRALLAQIQSNSGGAIQRAYGIQVSDMTTSGGGTIDDVYGIYIGDQTAGGTKNYALFTNRGDISLMSSPSDKVGFHGATPVAQQTVTGSRGGNAALASLLTKLANLGLLVDSTT